MLLRLRAWLWPPRRVVMLKVAAYFLVVGLGAAWTCWMRDLWRDPQPWPFYVAAGLLGVTALVLPLHRWIEVEVLGRVVAFRNGLVVVLALAVLVVPTVYGLFPFELTDGGRQLETRVSVMEAWAVITSLAVLRTALGDEREERRKEALALEGKLRDAVLAVGNANPRTGVVGLHWYVLTWRSQTELTVAYPLAAERSGGGDVLSFDCLALDVLRTEQPQRVSPPDPAQMRAGDLWLCTTAAAGIAWPVVTNAGLCVGVVVAYADKRAADWQPTRVDERVQAVATNVVSDIEKALRGVK